VRPDVAVLKHNMVRAVGLPSGTAVALIEAAPMLTGIIALYFADNFWTGRGTVPRTATTGASTHTIETTDPIEARRVRYRASRVVWGEMADYASPVRRRGYGERVGSNPPYRLRFERWRLERSR
jgi:hypothetical protein